MECVFEFDSGNKILRVSIIGEISGSELTDCYERTRECASKKAASSAILDLTNAQPGGVPAWTLRTIAESPPIIGDPALRVIVASSDYLYGLSRMFQTFGEKTREKVFVVRSLAEAYSLLNVDGPTFERV